MGTAPNCPLCWSNGLLKGGRVLAEGALLYAYVFENEDGSLKNAMINAKEHHANMTTLPGQWGTEFGEFYALVVDLLKGTPHNAYWNEGFVAGQRQLGHWHVHVIPRKADEPASDMGLGLLIAKYNEVMTTS